MKKILLHSLLGLIVLGFLATYITYNSVLKAKPGFNKQGSQNSAVESKTKDDFVFEEDLNDIKPSAEGVDLKYKEHYPLIFANTSNVIKPKGKVRVFLFIGDGNMLGYAGAGEFPAELRVPSDRVLKMYENGWGRLELNDKNNGPEVSFAYKAAKAYPEDTIGIIKVAADETAIKAFLPQMSKGKIVKDPLYEAIRTRIYQAQELSPNAEFMGVFVTAGYPASSQAAVNSSGYAEALKTLAAEIKNDAASQSLPFFIGVNEQTVQSKLPNLYSVGIGSLTKLQDGKRLNTQSEIKLGEMFFDAWSGSNGAGSDNTQTSFSLKNYEWDKQNQRYNSIYYGPVKKWQHMDFYPAKSNSSAPLVIWAHANGTDERKSLDGSMGSFIKPLLEQGMAIASIEFRHPYNEMYFNAPKTDVARAIQFLRYHEKEFGIDKRKVVLIGRSRGAGMSIWTAVQNDMADPGNEDPVLRESTRVLGVFAAQAQTTFNEQWILENFFSPAAAKKIIQSGEIPGNYGHAIGDVTPDDPPMYLTYEKPLSDDSPKSVDDLNVHDPRFGKFFKQAYEQAGIGHKLTLVNNLPAKNLFDGMTEWVKALMSSVK